MRYIDFKNPGSPEVLFLNHGAIPLPKANEVLVKVKAAGVNRPDIIQRIGKYPVPKDASAIMGLEVAGHVVKIGEAVSLWKIGDEICSLTNGGGYAEYCCIPEGQCLPIPDHLNLIEAASLPETYFTVWGNLFMRARLKPGEFVLIHAGASGIGSTAIQLAKAFGAQVATTVSGSKMSFCEALGADLIINYQTDDFLEVLKEDKVDVILDIIGGDYFEKNLALLRMEGRLAQIACMQAAKSTIDLNRLLFQRLTILGSTLRAQTFAAKADIAKELLQHVWPLFSKKLIRPVVTATFPLTEAVKAHQLMESSRHYGKIVLTVDS